MAGMQGWAPHVLFQSERIVLLHSFKEHNVLLRSFFKFLPTYETQKNRVGHLFFSKECNVLVFFYVLYKKNAAFFFRVIYFYISVYLYMYHCILKQRTQRSAFFCILLQKIETFSRFFTFLRK